MPMDTPFERLVAQVGYEAACAEMKRRRSLVKKPGFASMDKDKLRDLQAKGRAARKIKSDEDKLRQG